MTVVAPLQEVAPARGRVELLTAAEAADYLRSTVHTLTRWRYKRVGPPATKVGARVMYQRAHLDRWLEQRVQDPSATLSGSQGRGAAPAT